MDIARFVPQGGMSVALKRLKFCLDQLEEAKNFCRGIDWDRNIVHNLTVEELVGALVSAEQELVAQEYLENPQTSSFPKHLIKSNVRNLP